LEPIKTGEESWWRWLPWIKRRPIEGLGMTLELFFLLVASRVSQGSVLGPLFFPYSSSFIAGILQWKD